MHAKTVVVVSSCLVVSLVATSPVFASGSAGGLRVGGIGGWSLAEQGDINDTLDDLEEFWSPWEFDWEDEKLEEGPFFGGFAEYQIGSSWIVGLEYLRLSSNGGYHWSDEDSLSSVDVDADYDATSDLISVYGAYRLPVGESAASVRLGAGAGYLLGATFQMDFTAHMQSDMASGSRPETTEVWQTDLEATGSAVTFHAFIGLEYQLTDNLMLMGDVAYRSAYVDELEVDEIGTTVNGVPEETLWDIEKGEILRWSTDDEATFRTSKGDKVGLDFSGVCLSLRLAYAF